MLAPNRTYLAPTLFVDELVRAGVRHVCISPGSRSAPLALSCLSQQDLRAWSHVDERAGGFFALGLAKATRAPVALVCTSGTAAANFLPAVVEAYHAHVPLLVLTADRPPELRDCGAAQTIDQLRLFGTNVRWFAEVGTPEATVAGMRHARTLACRAVATATGPPAGPVHVNFPFREPLVPDAVPGDVPDAATCVAARGRAAAPYTRVSAARLAPPPGAVEHVARLLAGAQRPLVVAGPLDDPDPALPSAVGELARALGAPILAEPASNLRRSALDGVLVDAHGALARDPAFTAAHRPDAVVRLGGPPTSKTLATWLGALDAIPQLLIDATGTWTEPAAVAAEVLRGDLAPTCGALVSALPPRRERSAWTEAWRSAGAVARAALATAVVGAPPFEAHAVLALARVLPAGAVLYIGNSLAIRVLDEFWPAGAPTVRVLANRGANGIDGFVSSVLGAAADGDRPVVGVCGDLALYHDLNGLLAVRRYGLRAVLLVLNNDGGGIFDHLPVARCEPGYEEFFATPHGLDFRPAVEMYGCAFARVRAAADLPAALEAALAAPRATVVELAIDRAQSLAAYRKAWELACAAVEGRA